MSRVKKPGNKFMNTSKYPSSVTDISKMTRIHHEGEDYHNAKTLSAWLFMKYDMSYKTYRNKPKTRRDNLKDEFFVDTGRSYERYCQTQYKTEDGIKLFRIGDGY